jgi:hypothetical protein
LPGEGALREERVLRITDVQASEDPEDPRTWGLCPRLPLGERRRTWEEDWPALS